MLLLHRND